MLHPRHRDNRAGNFEVTLEFGPNILNGTVLLGWQMGMCLLLTPVTLEGDCTTANTTSTTTATTSYTTTATTCYIAKTGTTVPRGFKDLILILLPPSKATLDQSLVVLLTRSMRWIQKSEQGFVVTLAECNVLPPSLGSHNRASSGWVCPGRRCVLQDGPSPPRHWNTYSCSVTLLSGSHSCRACAGFRI